MRSVPQKIEPYLFYGFGEQAAKRATKHKFCVGTTACLYVCKAGLVSAMKIAHRYPWISVQSVAADETTGLVTVAFAAGTVRLAFPNCVSIASKIVAHLRSLLPDYHPVTYDVPPSVEMVEGTIGKMQLVDLYVSECYLLDCALDPRFVHALRKMLHREKVVRVDRAETSDANCHAMSAALVYAEQVKSIALGGKGFGKLWQRLARIVDVNQGIGSVSVFGYRKAKHFEGFVDGLTRSAVKSLSFKEVEFDSDMEAEFTGKLAETPVSVLQFQQCEFKKGSLCAAVSTGFLGTAGCMDHIRKFVLANDYVDPNYVACLIPILMGSVIEDMSVIDCQMNLQLFFDLFSASASSLNICALDVSGNFCPQGFTGDYSMPSTLNMLTLKRVRWEGNSLLTFLSKQTYMSMIEIDLSGAILDDDQVMQLVNEIPETPPTPSIKVMYWDSNPLCRRILEFFSEFKYLQGLTISHCYYPAHEKKKGILQGLLALLSKTNIQKLYIAESLKDFKDTAIRSLKDILSKHPTLCKLDISKNALGDMGLAALKDILKVNTRFTRLVFDEEGLSSPEVLIDFLEFVASVMYLRNISRPRLEMARLGEQFGRIKAHEMKVAWMKVAERKIPHMRGISASTTDFSNTSALVTTSDTVSTTTSMASQHLEANWDVYIEVDFDGGVREWDALKQEFSYAQITGVIQQPSA